MSQLVNELMNYDGVCRTALATWGLIIKMLQNYNNYIFCCKQLIPFFRGLAHTSLYVNEARNM